MFGGHSREIARLDGRSDGVATSNGYVERGDVEVRARHALVVSCGGDGNGMMWEKVSGGGRLEKARRGRERFIMMKVGTRSWLRLSYRAGF